MILQRLWTQPSPGSHGYVNITSKPNRSLTYPEVRDHQYVNINRSKDYGTIPLQNSAIREQESFKEVCSM